MLNNLIKDKDYSVLIVEDDSILAIGMEVKLQNMGLSVSSIATTPEQAMLHAENNYPDLAIVDINLNASKTGIDVANHIWRKLNIPIIFLTSYYNDRILNKAMESEPYAYLLKPCRDEELKVAINTTLHKHQFFFKNKEILNRREEKFIYLDENVKFDTINAELFIDEKAFKLTKNEKKLFEIMTKEAEKVVSFDTIFNYIWREDVYDLAKLRTLIYRLKIKLGFSPFENLHDLGYRIKVNKKIA